jgi:hypothetical protein
MYLGPNSNNSEKVLHLYSGSSSVEKEPFSGTNFHSSTPYTRIIGRYLYQYSSYASPFSRFLLDTGISTPIPSTVLASRAPSIAIGYTYSISNNSWQRVVFSGGNSRWHSSILSSGPAVTIYGGFFGNNVQGYPSIYLRPEGYVEVRNDFGFNYIELIYFDDLQTLPTSNSVSISDKELKINGVNLLGGKNLKNQNTTRYLHFLGTDPNNRINDVDEIIPIPTGQALPAVDSFPIGGIVLQSSNNIFGIDIVVPSYDPNYYSNVEVVYYQVLNSKVVPDVNFLDFMWVKSGTDLKGLEFSSYPNTEIRAKANINGTEVTYPVTRSDRYLHRIVGDYRNMILQLQGDPIPPVGSCVFLRSYTIDFPENCYVFATSGYQDSLTESNYSPCYSPIVPIDGAVQVLDEFISYIKVVYYPSSNKIDIYACKPAGSLNFISNSTIKFNLLIFSL